MPTFCLALCPALFELPGTPQRLTPRLDAVGFEQLPAVPINFMIRCHFDLFVLYLFY